MAGKTLPGIGDDEESDDKSGERDTSGPSLSGANTEEPTPGRSTERMHNYSGPTVIDEDKVAEGLKRLRSLDEPLGPIPSSMPTLKEGMPVVDGMPVVGGAPLTSTPTVQNIAELLRARGTAHGHAIGPGAPAEASLPVTIDDRMKGTLLGHMVHLPDLPGGAEESRPAEVFPVEPTSSLALTPVVQHDFSNGEARFFDREPERPFEAERPHSKLLVRGAIVFAALAIGLVAIIAWTRSSKTESAGGGMEPLDEAPTTTLPSSAALGQEPATAPPSGATTLGTPTDPSTAQAAAAASASPTPAPAATAPAPTTTAKPPSPTPAAKAPAIALDPAPEAAPPPSHPVRHAPAATSPSDGGKSHGHAVHGAPAAPENSPAATAPATPGKKAAGDKDDPDGTLPLTD